MATIANQYDPNDPDAEDNAGGGGTTMPPTGGGGNAPEPGSSGSASASSSRPTPSGAPNVQAYLNANKGAGEQLTQGITGNVQNQANKLNQGVSQSQKTLNSQYQPLQQNLGASGQQVIQQAFKDPQALLDSYNAAKSQTASSQPLSSQQQTDADQYNQFQNLNNGGYNSAIQNYGVAGQNEYNNLQNQLGSLRQVTNSGNNEMGRNQLLQKMVGQPTYNQGQQTLDALFLQGQPGGLNKLQGNLKGIQTGANQNAASFGADTQSKLAALQGLSAQDQASIKNLFMNGGEGGTGINQIASNVGNEYTNAKENAANTDLGLQSAFKSNKFTPEQLQQLGLTSGTQTWGVDLSQAGGYKANPLAAAEQGGYAQVATPEEFARYNALNQLAGGPTGLQPNMFGSSTSAGGYNPVSYDTNALNQAIEARKNAVTNTDFHNTVQGTQAALNNLSNSHFTNATASNFANQLNSAKTPEEANQMIQNYITSLKNRGINNNMGDYSALNPWSKYFAEEYTPAFNSQIGVSNPESSPLPPGGVAAAAGPGGPTGGAGKGGGGPDDEDMLPDK